MFQELNNTPGQYFILMNSSIDWMNQIFDEYDYLDSRTKEYSILDISREECNDCEYSGNVVYHLHKDYVPFVEFSGYWSDGDLDNIDNIKILNQFLFDEFKEKMKRIFAEYVSSKILDQV